MLHKQEESPKESLTDGWKAERNGRKRTLPAKETEEKNETEKADKKVWKQYGR